MSLKCFFWGDGVRWFFEGKDWVVDLWVVRGDSGGYVGVDCWCLDYV